MLNHLFCLFVLENVAQQLRVLPSGAQKALLGLGLLLSHLGLSVLGTRLELE